MSGLKSYLKAEVEGGYAGYGDGTLTGADALPLRTGQRVGERGRCASSGSDGVDDDVGDGHDAHGD